MAAHLEPDAHRRYTVMMRSRYDSRRWTGRYRPGEEPPEFAPPYRRRSTRWKLAAFTALGVALAVMQLRASDEHRMPFFIAALLIWPAPGLSPYARGPFYAAHAGYDASEAAVVAHATARAYRWMCGVVVGLFGYLALASRQGWPAPHRTADWLAWGIALAIIATHLPPLLAELRNPLPAKPERA